MKAVVSIDHYTSEYILCGGILINNTISYTYIIYRCININQMINFLEKSSLFIDEINKLSKMVNSEIQRRKDFIEMIQCQDFMDSFTK